MAKIFISYMRKDQVFVRHLHEKLGAQGHDVWADFEDIPLSAKWLAEIYDGIEKADVVVSILSPEYLVSENCNKEVEHSVQNNKRLIPIVRRDVDPKQVRKELADLNWIFFRDTEDFDTKFQELTRIINTDLDWVKAHTRLTVRAIEWENKKRDDSCVLRGGDLQEAEEWQALAATGKEPKPTPLQSEYILASRKSATARQQREQELQNQAQRRLRWLLVAGAILVTLALVAVSVPVYWEFLRQSALANGELVNVPGSSVAIERYEVTNNRYGMCVQTGRCIAPAPQLSTFFQSDSGAFPVAGIDALQARRYCEWIGRRLPTRSEWIQAATNGGQTKWPWGDEPEPTKEYANLDFGGLPDPQVEKVGEFKRHTPTSIFDLAGNIEEWTETLWENSGKEGGEWQGASDPDLRLFVMGGSYRFTLTGLGNLETGVPAEVSFRQEDTGFRCVQERRRQGQ